MAVKRTKEPTPVVPAEVHPLPTTAEISDVIQSYRDAGWGWETLQRESGVNHAVLRKMLANETDVNVWYSIVEKFWNFHIERMSA